MREISLRETTATTAAESCPLTKTGAVITKVFSCKPLASGLPIINLFSFKRERLVFEIDSICLAFTRSERKSESGSPLTGLI